MTEFFKKKKNPTWGPFWALFAQIWAKINFPGKRRLCKFLDILIIYNHVKHQKNAELTDGQTDIQATVILWNPL